MEKMYAACLTLAVAVSAGMPAQNVQASEELVGIQAALESQAEEAAEQNTEAQSDILIAYFTWAENAVIDETVDAVTSPSVTEPGNVGQLAGWVQEETGGDLFSIKVTDPYPADWDACLERANEERGNNARPELEENVSGLEQYETVFLGYPNWLAYHKLIQCTQLA